MHCSNLGRQSHRLIATRADWSACTARELDDKTRKLFHRVPPSMDQGRACLDGWKAAVSSLDPIRRLYICVCVLSRLTFTKIALLSNVYGYIPNRSNGRRYSGKGRV